MRLNARCIAKELQTGITRLSSRKLGHQSSANDAVAAPQNMTYSRSGKGENSSEGVKLSC